MTVPAFFPADVRIIRTYTVQKKSIYRKICGKNLFIEKSAEKKAAEILGIQLPFVKSPWYNGRWSTVTVR